MNGKEVWKTVSIAPSYEVSNTGKVRKRNEKVLLNQPQDSYGYKVVSIFYEGKWQIKAVHRLVAMAFLGMPKDKEQVNHKNGIKDDNNIENLEWVTPAENIQHSYKVLGRKKPPIRKKREGGRGMRTNLKLFRVGTHLTQEEFARKCGVSRAVYSNIERGKVDASGAFWEALQKTFNVPDEDMYKLQKLDKEGKKKRASEYASS